MKTFRTIATICALSTVAGAAAAQTSTVTMTPSQNLLALSCIAGAASKFGATNPTIVGANPIPGGMEFHLMVPGKTDPWACKSIRGEAYN